MAADGGLGEHCTGSESRWWPAEQIAEIRASALSNVEVVAKDTAEALVAALGLSADKAALDAAVDKRIEG